MYSEPGGTLLDNMSVLYMNDLGDGLGHNWMDLPVMLIGGMKGYFKQGQYIKMTTGTGTANDKDAPDQPAADDAGQRHGRADDQLRQRPHRQGRRADRAEGLTLTPTRASGCSGRNPSRLARCTERKRAISRVPGRIAARCVM